MKKRQSILASVLELKQAIVKQEANRSTQLAKT
jgi:hypothetical protein